MYNIKLFTYKHVCLTMAMVKIEKIHTTLLIMHALTESAFGDMSIGKQEWARKTKQNRDQTIHVT